MASFSGAVSGVVDNVAVRREERESSQETTFPLPGIKRKRTDGEADNSVIVVDEEDDLKPNKLSRAFREYSPVSLRGICYCFPDLT